MEILKAAEWRRNIFWGGYVVKKIIACILAAVLTVGLCACGQNGSTWDEQYDLGVRYLSDGNYEEAILAFTAAIEIDPKRAEAYVGRGNAYLGQGAADEYLAAAFTDFETALSLDDTNADAYLGMAEVYIARKQFDEAMEILRQGVEKTGDQRLTDRLAELEDGNIADYWGQTLKQTHYDGNGALTCWFEYDYNDLGQCAGITSYGPDGSQIQYVEQRYDEQDRMIYGCNVWYNDGKMGGAIYTYNSMGLLESIVEDSGDSMTIIYDSDGRQIRTDFYDETGKLIGHATQEYGDNYERYNNYNASGALENYRIYLYNEQEQPVRCEYYDADGTLTHYTTDEYDADGNRIACNIYDADGNLTGRDTYN